MMPSHVAILLVTFAAVQLPTDRPCKATLAACPAYGCAQPGTPNGTANEIRRTWRGGVPPRLTLTVDDLEVLQVATDSVVRQGFAIPLRQRHLLTRIGKKSGMRFGERDVVQVLGFIVGTPRRRRSDSANCNLIGLVNNNFRFNLAADASDTDFDSIVVEITPQHRPATWTLTKLRKLHREQRLLLVRGQLFYDSQHLVNNDPDADIAGQPHRLSLWEIHPVTEVLVCTATTNDCLPDNLATWEPLASYD